MIQRLQSLNLILTICQNQILMTDQTGVTIDDLMHDDNWLIPKDARMTMIGVGVTPTRGSDVPGPATPPVAVVHLQSHLAAQVGHHAAAPADQAGVCVVVRGVLQ